jgi:two-component system, response regulator PdtaR
MIATSIQQRFTASVPAGRSPPIPVGQGPAEALARIPVLVIEDEAMIAWMLESLLEDMGFEAITLASDAKEATAAAKRRTPGLIISDINLGPGADGIEAVGAIRRACSPAVVFVSAYIDETAQNRIAEQVSGARILQKPLTGDGLYSVVRDALGMNRAN